MWRRALVTCLVLAWPLGAPAQEAAPSPILVIDQERLLEESAFGVALRARLEDAARALAAENRQIEADLGAEERELTERRPTLPVEEFRALADEFDAKVQRLREEQDAKSDALTQMSDEGRRQFFSLLAPVLSGVLRERGAVLLIDRRNAILSADSIDITDEAIARIDAAIGTGGQSGTTAP